MSDVFVGLSGFFAGWGTFTLLGTPEVPTWLSLTAYGLAAWAAAVAINERRRER